MVDKIIKKLSLITVLLIIVITIVFFFTHPKPEIKELKELKIDLTVGNHTGINMDADALHFGTIKKGEVKTLIREIVVSNNDLSAKKVRLFITGNLSEQLKISQNNFIVLPAENKTISITAIINPEREYGTYEGVLKAVFHEIRDGEN